MIRIEKNFYDNADEDFDGYYYYDKSGSLWGNYELLKEVIIETAIKMYNVYLLEKKKSIFAENMKNYEYNSQKNKKKRRLKRCSEA